MDNGAAVASELDDARARLVTRRAHGTERWLADPRLTRIARGAYLEADPAWPAWKAGRMVGLARVLWLLQLNPESVFTLETGALLHGLPVVGRPGELHVATGSSGCQRRTVLSSAGRVDSHQTIVWRHGHQVDGDDVTEVHGIRVVSLDRLMLDMARFRPAYESLPVTDSALRFLTDASRFRQEATRARAEPIRSRLLHRLAELGRARGVARAREVISLTEPLAESSGESKMRWVPLALGLPVPAVQRHVHVEGKDFYLDAWIEELRLGMEYDGHAKYDTSTPAGRSAFMSEKRRDDLLLSAGLIAHHFMQQDVQSLAAGRAALARCVGPEALARYTPRRHLLERWRTPPDPGGGR